MIHSLSGKCICCMSINKELLYIRFNKESNLHQKKNTALIGPQILFGGFQNLDPSEIGISNLSDFYVLDINHISKFKPPMFIVQQEYFDVTCMTG